MMLVIALVTYWIIGAIAGMLAGLLGVGGGLFIVPMLLFILPLTGVQSEQLMTIAVASSLATIVFTSIASVRAHHLARKVHWDIVKAWIPGLILGAIIGVLIADMAPQEFPKTLFGLCALAVAWKMMSAVRHVRPMEASTPRIPKKPWQYLHATWIATASSLIGIGGGAFSVPLLKQWRVPINEAVATSSAIGLPLSIAATISFIVIGWDQQELPNYTFGYLYWPAIIGIVSSSVIFAPLGAKLAHRISKSKLSALFALFLLIVGLKIILD